MNDVPRRPQPPTTCRMVTVGHAHVHHLLRQLFIFGCWPGGAKCKQMYRAHRRGPRGSSRGVEIDCMLWRPVVLQMNSLVPMTNISLAGHDGSVWQIWMHLRRLRPCGPVGNQADIIQSSSSWNK